MSRDKRGNKWCLAFGCRRKNPSSQSSGRSLQREWRGFPDTFQVPDEREVSEDSVTTQNNMDDERRASTYRYKDMKAFLKNLYQ
ncbi:hypothetical protein ACROYT_G023841 [Oculina patagonica]